jgi:type I restriction enzyme S subunit
VSSDLPLGWCNATVGDIADINPRGLGQDLDEDAEVSFIPMAAVEESTGRASVEQTRRWGAVRRGYTPMRDGDIVFAKITPCMENGKIALLQGMKNGVGVGSTELVAIRPRDSVDARYLLNFLLQETIRRDARAVMQGASGQLRVPITFLRNLPLSLPPLPEQRRIVVALEEHLSALDAAVAGLERARTRLSLYVESSVQAAVSNMLERGLMDGDTNTQFEWRPLAAVLADIGQGWSPRCLPDPPADEESWAVIKTTAIQPFRFDSSECKGLPEGLSPRPEIEIHVGDLLVTRKGPRSRAGVAAAVKQTRSRVMICDTVYRIRLKAEMARPHFMAIAMSSTMVAAAIDRAKAGISESGLSLTHDRLGAVLVPLPPLGVQEAIENEIDRRVQVVDRVNADIDLQLARAARLRQSVLQRAFSGGLVPQDPAEAPASNVPEPDRTERSSAPASSRPTRGRGRSARTGSRRG